MPPQAVVNSALKDLNLLSARVQSLNLFSPNEALDELSTRNLLYITLPFILAEVELHARSIKRDERLERLRRAYVCIALSFFLSSLGLRLSRDRTRVPRLGFSGEEEGGWGGSKGVKGR